MITRLSAAPRPYRLAQRGLVAVRVDGRCHGFLWCGRSLSPVFGRFGRVWHVPARQGSCTVWALGLLGVRRLVVPIEPVADLRPPVSGALQPVGRVRVVPPAARIAAPGAPPVRLSVQPVPRSRPGAPLLRTLAPITRLAAPRVRLASIRLPLSSGGTPA